MKNKVVILAIGVLTAASVLASPMKAMMFPEGGRVGNGGGLVVCRNPVTHVPRSIELLDYYEAKSLRGVKLDLARLSGDWKSRTQQIINRLQALTPMRVEIYTEWLKRFDQESSFLKDVEFSTLPDAAFVAVPKGCEFEQGVIQRRPQFKGDARYFINQALWSQMSDSQKAGLIFHEFLYREAIGYGHTDSISVRHLNGAVLDVNFKSLDEKAWNELLTEAKFEMNDNAYPNLDATVKIDVSKIWLAGPTEVVPEITLKKRLPVLLGLCKGDGCQIFLARSRNEVPTWGELSFDLHYMFRQLDFGAYRAMANLERPSGEIITSIGIYQDKIDYLAWFTLEEGQMKERSVFFTAQAITGQGAIYESEISQITFVDGLLQSLNAYSLQDDSQMIYGNTCGIYNARQLGLKGFSSIQKSKDCAKKANYNSPVYANILGGSVRVYLKKDEASEMDFNSGTGLYYAGGEMGEITYVLDKKNPENAYQYTCRKAFKETEAQGCMIKLNQDSGEIKSVKLKTSVTFTYPHARGYNAYAILSPQIIELYPSGVFKSALMEVDSGLLPKRDGTEVVIKAGDTLKLDADGFILN